MSDVYKNFNNITYINGYLRRNKLYL
jgi:hypothetical protein